MEISILKIRLLLRNSVFILLALNMLWVLIGYALGTASSSSAVENMRIFKTFFVLISFIYVIHKNGINLEFLSNKRSVFLVIIGVSILAFFSAEPFPALYRSLTFVYPFLYIMFSVNYLLRYEALNLLIALSFAILIVYAFVTISYFVFGVNTNTANIYGHQEGNFFVSNHYGWGSALFVLSALTILRFYPLKFYIKLPLILYLPFVFYLLIISGSRSGILSVVLALTLFIIKDNFVKLFTKTIIILGIIIVYSFVAVQENSVISYLQEKNNTQLETGEEGRLIGTEAMLRSFDHNPVYWFTGVGMFDYTQLNQYGGILPTYHNSYWEILFGSGLIVFVFFVIFMVIHPLKIFWKLTSSYSLLIFPLMIIPFFEGDITAGQFLFFPWFSYMVLLNAKEFSFIYKQQKILSKNQ